MYREPENTLKSIWECAKTGADSVEFDVWMTKDGVPVVYHGGEHGEIDTNMSVPTLDAQRLRIEDLTWSQVASLRFRISGSELVCPTARVIASKGIPSLRGVLELCKATGLRPTCELKGSNTAEPTVRLLVQFGLLETATCSSFKLDLLVQAKQADHRVRTAALFDNFEPNFVVKSKAVHADEVHVRWDHATRQRVQTAHDAGLAVMAWVNHPKYMSGQETAELYRAIARTGVDAMCINKPELLIKVLDSMPSGLGESASTGIQGSDLRVSLNFKPCARASLERTKLAGPSNIVPVSVAPVCSNEAACSDHTQPTRTRSVVRFCRRRC